MKRSLKTRHLILLLVIILALALSACERPLQEEIDEEPETESAYPATLEEDGVPVESKREPFLPLVTELNSAEGYPSPSGGIEFEASQETEPAEPPEPEGLIYEVQPGDTVYDLNAGDGRGLVIAARDFGARAAGIEVEPLHCAVAWLRALFGGVIARVSVHRGDLFRAELSSADVVFLYPTPALLARLRPRLEYELRPNTRIVSMLFPLEGWEPAGIDIGHLIFCYRTPLKSGSIDSYLRQSIAESP